MNLIEWGFFYGNERQNSEWILKEVLFGMAIWFCEKKLENLTGRTVILLHIDTVTFSLYTMENTILDRNKLSYAYLPSELHTTFKRRHHDYMRMMMINIFEANFSAWLTNRFLQLFSLDFLCRFFQSLFKLLVNNVFPFRLLKTFFFFDHQINLVNSLESSFDLRMRIDNDKDISIDIVGMIFFLWFLIFVFPCLLHRWHSHFLWQLD